MTEPTPRPWRQGGVFGMVIEGAEIARDRQGRPVYPLLGEVYRGRDISHAEARANLDLIVRAVNAHDELVGALELIAACSGGKTLISAIDERYDIGANLAFEHCAEIAKAALAKAKGDENAC